MNRVAVRKRESVSGKLRAMQPCDFLALLSFSRRARPLPDELLSGGNDTLSFFDATVTNNRVYVTRGALASLSNRMSVIRVETRITVLSPFPDISRFRSSNRRWINIGNVTNLADTFVLNVANAFPSKPRAISLNVSSGWYVPSPSPLPRAN